MDPKLCANQLRLNAEVITTLLQVTTEQARRNPTPDRWSLLEVINHPQRPYPPNDPVRWVKSRRYNQRALKRSLEGFLEEREQSLRWLATLESVDWDARPAGEKKLRAGDLMVSWVAHDFFHIRQISTLHWDYLEATSAPYSTSYAGALV